MSARVNVLLATFNGARFLREQLQSISAQTLPVSRVTVRDDGSTDDTVRLVQEWASGRPGVALLQGAQLGVTKNFLTLLASPDENSDYFAFCDQDDVWLPHKIENAVGALEECGCDVPAMYFSRIELVDERLQHLGYSRAPRRTGFGNALVENIAIGCSMLLNRRARDLICERLPEKAVMHDWWCYVVVSAFGRVVYDDRPGVRYRQHAGNVLGGASWAIEHFRRRLSRFLTLPRGARLLGEQAEEFLGCFGEALRPQYRTMLERFLCTRGNIWARVSYGAAMDVWRQTWVDTALLRAMILLGRA